MSGLLSSSGLEVGSVVPEIVTGGGTDDILPEWLVAALEQAEAALIRAFNTIVRFLQKVVWAEWSPVHHAAHGGGTSAVGGQKVKQIPVWGGTWVHGGSSFFLEVLRAQLNDPESAVYSVLVLALSITWLYVHTLRRRRLRGQIRAQPGGADRGRQMR